MSDADLTPTFLDAIARQEKRDEAFIVALERLGVSEGYIHAIRHDLMAAITPTVGILPKVLERLDENAEKLDFLIAALGLEKKP